MTLSKSPNIANGAWGNGTRAKAEQRGFFSAGKTKEGEATVTTPATTYMKAASLFKKARLP
jgi:hypothetical protein